MPESAMLIKVTALNILISGIKSLRFLVHAGLNDKVKDLIDHVSKACFGRVVKLDVFGDWEMKNRVDVETVIEQNGQYYSLISSEYYYSLLEKLNDPIEVNMHASAEENKNKNTTSHDHRLKQLKKIQNESKLDNTQIHLHDNKIEQFNTEIDSRHVIVLNDNKTKGQGKKNAPVDDQKMKVSIPKDSGCCCNCAIF